MGHWRFRKSVKIFPGVRVNINTKSTSLTIGGRGFKTTISKHGTRRTVGIPGTGISYTEYEKHTDQQRPSVAPDRHLSYATTAREPEIDTDPGITLAYYMLGTAFSAITALKCFLPTEGHLGGTETMPGLGSLMVGLSLFLVIKGFYGFVTTKSATRREAAALKEELGQQVLAYASNGVWDPVIDPRFPCPHCRRAKRTQEALDHHIRDAHGVTRNCTSDVLLVP